VYFVDSTQPLVRGLLFHQLDLTQNDRAEFTHLCKLDIYQGRFTILGQCAFNWDWEISGPHKEGKIWSHYEKSTEISSEGVP
jgi:hypothetical protein